jgi:hypothetical protein
MPDPATPGQSATGTRPRLSLDGTAPPLPGGAPRGWPLAPGRLRAAISQLRGMTRRALGRP